MRIKYVKLRNLLRLTLILSIEKKKQISSMRRREDLILLNRMILKSSITSFCQHCEINFAIKNINSNCKKIRMSLQQLN